MTPQNSQYPVLTAGEAWAAVHHDQSKAYVVVSLTEAHLFNYPGFVALQIPALDDGVFFKHPGRSAVQMRRLGPAPRYVD